MAEFDDIDFQRRLEEKRHKETTKLLAGISGILEGLNIPELDTTPLSDALLQQQSSLNKLAEKLDKIGDSKIEVKTDTKELAKIVGELKSGLLAIKDGIYREQAPVEWEFQIKRNIASNLIESVIAKQK